MAEGNKEDLLRLPQRWISSEDANRLSKQGGGIAGEDPDFPAFARRDKKRAHNLPKADLPKNISQN